MDQRANISPIGDKPAPKHNNRLSPFKQWEMMVTDKIAEFAGDIRFIYYHLAIFAVWITVNIFREESFDEYPFILLTLVVSLEAIFLATFVLINQNKDARRSARRSQADFEVDQQSRAELAELKKHILDIKTAIAIKNKKQ